jgi:hypothetical protein
LYAVSLFPVSGLLFPQGKFMQGFESWYRIGNSIKELRNCF